jgi:predicted dehydrogenase
MTKTFRFGVIGCGLMGREFASAAARWLHLSNPAARPEIVAVCDTNASLMDWFAENVPTVKQRTTDYREMLANPEIDAIYCAVPHVLHQEFYIAILEAGKHLLGEKPFGMDLMQNRAIMAALAKRPDLVVRCSSEMPFFPGAQKVIQMANAGAFGDIIEVEAGFLHSSDLDRKKPINWKRMEHVNGDYGCMGDLGMHVLHVPLRLGWKPQTVHSLHHLGQCGDQRAGQHRHAGLPDAAQNLPHCARRIQHLVHTRAGHEQERLLLDQAATPMAMDGLRGRPPVLANRRPGV